MSGKLTDAQKASRAATRENNKLRKEMPLFAQADAIELTTEHEQRVRLQLAAAKAGENCGIISGGRILETLTERHLARLVRERVSPEVFAKLEHYNRNTYPSVTYWSGFWFRVLTGTRVVFAWRCEATGPRTMVLENGLQVTLPSGKLLEDGALQFDPPPFTREQLLELFPIRSVNAAPTQPDDGGLWATVQAAIDRAAAHRVRVMPEPAEEQSGPH